MSLIVTVASGQGGNAFSFIGEWDGGVRYNDTNPSMPPQIDIYAAKWQQTTEEWQYISPGVSLYAFQPTQTCCVVPETHVVQPIPEPSTGVLFGLALLAYLVFHIAGFYRGRG